MKVFVYFNLHRKCWSVKALEGPDKGRVIQHAASVRLSDCTFKVSEAGRQRVLREKRKNVHAGVVGTLCNYATRFDADYVDISGVRPITYNPYRFASFVDAEFHMPVRSAARVAMTGRLVVAGGAL